MVLQEVLLNHRDRVYLEEKLQQVVALREILIMVQVDKDIIVDRQEVLQQEGRLHEALQQEAPQQEVLQAEDHTIADQVDLQVGGLIIVGQADPQVEDHTTVDQVDRQVEDLTIVGQADRQVEVRLQDHQVEVVLQEVQDLHQEVLVEVAEDTKI